MISQKLNIKPLSVNQAWQGKRFKTRTYNYYEHHVILLLKTKKLNLDGKLKIKLTFGLSSKNMDWDNPIKPFVDILQKKYNFNDNQIYSAVVEKVIAPKGKEYIEFTLENV